MIDEAFLQHPCQPISAGSTVSTLAKGYIHAVDCIGMYKDTLDAIAEHNKKPH